ncbi:hypothetical protein PLCT1_01894 [Planctomycetaceae bacterium]|nr:hypothetical protein PLCT1_01894 [Planctomycetaceae bacterium]
MSASDFWAPPADSADLESYSSYVLRRAPLPAFGSAVPPREAYSRVCPGVVFGESDELTLEDSGYRRLVQAGRYYAPTKPRAMLHAARYDFLSAPQFVCLMSTPFWTFALVWLMGLL